MPGWVRGADDGHIAGHLAAGGDEGAVRGGVEIAEEEARLHAAQGRFPGLLVRDLSKLRS